MSRQQILDNLRNAKTSIEREYWQKQLMQWDGLENIVADNYAKRVSKAKYKPKPKGRIDARSHKHAFQDATVSPSGAGVGIPGIGICIEYVISNNIIDVPLLLRWGIEAIPMWVKFFVLLFGLGWWIIVYVATLQRKRQMEF